MIILSIKAVKKVYVSGNMADSTWAVHGFDGYTRSL
jgi:hypothetical protein